MSEVDSPDRSSGREHFARSSILDSTMAGFPDKCRGKNTTSGTVFGLKDRRWKRKGHRVSCENVCHQISSRRLSLGLCYRSAVTPPSSSHPTADHPALSLELQLLSRLKVLLMSTVVENLSGTTFLSRQERPSMARMETLPPTLTSVGRRTSRCCTSMA